MEQQDLNKRLLLALALSFFVFVGYSYLFPPQKQVAQTEQNISNTQTPKAVTTQSTPKSTPVNMDKAQNAPKSASTGKALATVTSNTFKITIDEFGRIAQYELLEAKYKDAEGHNLQILGTNEVKPLEVRFSDAKINDEAFKTPYTLDGSASVDVSSNAQILILTQKLSTLTVTKKITVKPDGSYDIDVTTSSPAPYFITPGHRPMADSSRYMLVRGALVEGADGVITTIPDGDAKGTETFKNAKIASAFDRYVATMFYDFKKGMNVSILKVGNDDPLIFVEGGQNLHLGGYIGPKEYNILKNINPELTNTIEFGWFTFLSRPFFKVLLWIHGLIGNWGWAIILFTLLVKLTLFPLSYKGMMSMQKLKDLAPKMKDLKAKYKGDPAKLNAQMMELYKKNGANPMGGCLPMILQIPVFFALYRVLLNADELQGATWISGWISNLAGADPYYILPVLMGVTMWFQQRITPNNFTDPLQEKIFKWFPVLMAGMFIIMPFPSGLVLYWVVNNIFTIGQQYVINKAYARHKEAAIAAHHKKEKES
ncbi:insertase [Sulfurovum lithotrophicum]|uniref:Membrane protein insertase YidC n=1 Tax=Sulfurovum lithotrophicum TaxID=206403 RepID=A0A7U4M1L2_9BACT|nr:membrane protein insertase YidC [Sulfurovum lithotrophicum]AKF25203.1 insertase [Sulfurovum lithotrophicum]